MNINKKIKIAIFASGNGSNAENIIKFFKNHENICVELILTNNPNAYVIERAKNNNVKCIIFNKDDLYNSDKILNILKEHNIDFIVLAGFLWLIPKSIILNYPRKIINIHPALLPKYGGKGMYGMNVHKAVIENKEKLSGITIHYVNENYDEGDIIFQKELEITHDETPETLAEKIHKLEYQYYPLIIEKVINELFYNNQRT